MNVIVLCGGESAERAVSLRSGARVAAALRAAGDGVSLWDWRGAPFSKTQWAALRAADAVFLALHGGAGEDGTLQARLEAGGVRHYTGSAPLGAARAMDKARAKGLVAAAGVAVAAGALWRPGTPPPVLPFPFVVKPCGGGSSVGFRIVKSAAEAARIVPREPMLCEAYLAGREFTVGILDGVALPAVEIAPRGGVYDYAHKYTPGAVRELCPAPLAPAHEAALRRAALTAFRALGLRDYARIDFKNDACGRTFFLEANALPGMTATSLLPIAARAAGLPYGALCRRMAQIASARKKI